MPYTEKPKSDLLVRTTFHITPVSDKLMGDLINRKYFDSKAEIVRQALHDFLRQHMILIEWIETE